MATQLCPCGRYRSANQECTCQIAQIQKYVGKISEPLFDRIDIHVEVPTVQFSDLASKKSGENSLTIRDRVIRARERQASRFAGRTGVYCNADMTAEEIKTHCLIDAAGMELLKAAMSRLGLSARAYDRILKVARTIADLSGSESIRVEHLGEAIEYRSLDRTMLAM